MYKVYILYAQIIHLGDSLEEIFKTAKKRLKEFIEQSNDPVIAFLFTLGDIAKENMLNEIIECRENKSELDFLRYIIENINDTLHRDMDADLKLSYIKDFVEAYYKTFKKNRT